MTDRTGIVIQARMGSTRLPGKILMPIGGLSLLGHALVRALSLGLPVVVASSLAPENDRVELWCNDHGIACFRGSEENVLERYVRCAELHGFGHIVRLTGDNPFPDAEELQKLLALHHGAQADFSTSFEMLPVGVGAEVFTLAALRNSLEKADAPHHFEHVDEYLLEHLGEVRHVQLSSMKNKCAPEVRLTVDTQDDLVCVRNIVHAAGDMVTTEEAIRLWRTQAPL